MTERFAGRSVGSRLLAVRRNFGLCAFALACVACARPYQVGDHILVEWGEGKLLYPAFIIEKKDNSRYRVHYEGYSARWDELVSLPRIQGLVEGKVTPPPPPLKVRVALGLQPTGMGVPAPISQFKDGDKIRVKWRESVYRASILQVVSATELKVTYEGHEEAWDEVIPVSRVVD